MENDLKKGWRGKGGSGLDGILYCLVKMLSLAAAPTTDQRGNAIWVLKNASTLVS